MSDILGKIEKLSEHMENLKKRVEQLETENTQLKQTISSMEKNDVDSVKKLEQLLDKLKVL